jgi:hypothetical protein
LGGGVIVHGREACDRAQASDHRHYVSFVHAVTMPLPVRAKATTLKSLDNCTVRPLNSCLDSLDAMLRAFTNFVQELIIAYLKEYSLLKPADKPEWITND